MEDFDRKKHWETIYETKSLQEVSWYQAKPKQSLELIQKSGLAKDAAIIDIGGGDSFLVDHLLAEGYTNITVLDISAAAIARAKERLGSKASDVTWVVSDMLDFAPNRRYDCWHDRAAFHFLTTPAEREQYRTMVSDAIAENGQLIMATFSENGPKKCSGIEIKSFSEEALQTFFEAHFSLQQSFQTDHETPFATKQHFTFCHFQKK